MKLKILKWAVRWLWLHHEDVIRVVVREFGKHVHADPERKKGVEG